MENNEPLFSDKDLKKLASRFKILSETSRLKILRSLFDKELCVSEIMKATGLMQANASKQLRILEKNKIVKCRPAGLQRYYAVSDDTVLEICKLLCRSKK
jgi:DNA-binding transcriptional ArsR family regulator